MLLWFYDVSLSKCKLYKMSGKGIQKNTNRLCSYTIQEDLLFPMELKLYSYKLQYTWKIFDGITTAWIDKRQPIQHRLQFKKQV